MAIRQTVSKYKYSIALLLLFVLVENIAWIIEPTFFGKLLDALMESLGSIKDLNIRFNQDEMNINQHVIPDVT
jgi:hypothetical protein